MNDDHLNPNLKVAYIVDDNQIPRPCFFANKDISAGSELRYFYGREGDHPWRREKVYLCQLSCLCV